MCNQPFGIKLVIDSSKVNFRPLAQFAVINWLILFVMVGVCAWLGSIQPHQASMV